MPTGLRKRAEASHCPEQLKKAIRNGKEKQKKKINASIYNFAATGSLTRLLFVTVNSPCCPVSLRDGILICIEKH